MNAHSIGAAARQTGCSVPTIRYYEEIGLLPAAPRTDGNRRHYDRPALQRLGFIKRCRDFGFSLEQIRDLIGLSDAPARDCVELRDVAQVHLGEVRRKLVELQELEASLAAFVRSCNSACAGGPVADCTILEKLAGSPARAAPKAAAGGRGCCG
jgi:DNA-binding transcriptional MerR regulator